MSTQSLKEHVTKKPFSGSVFRAKTSKLQKIHVAPSPQLNRANNANVAEPEWPVTGNGLPSLTPTKEGQRLSTPSMMNGHENIALELDDSSTLWSKIENGNKHHQNSSSILPRQRGCSLNEVYLMRFLIALAFIFSVTNICLTIILMRGQNKNCACQEKSELLGKVP